MTDGTFQPSKLSWTTFRSSTLPFPAPPSFPSQPDATTVNAIGSTILDFAKVMRASVALVALIEPERSELLQQIVRQYFRAVICPGREWLLTYKYSKLAELESLYQDLEGECQGDISMNSWIKMTVFDAVYGAIASHLGGHIDNLESSEFSKQLRDWLKQVHKSRLCPFAVAFDVERQLVGTSTAYWNHRAIFQEWESNLRDSCFPEEVRAHLSEIRGILHRVIDDNPEASKTELIAIGRRAVGEELTTDCLSARLCRGSRWLSVRAKDLEPLDQCSGCQIIFADVVPVNANSPEPHRRLGENFKTPWQCAETHLLAQLYELEIMAKAGDTR